LPEAVWFASCRHGKPILFRIIARFGFCGRDISDRFKQATIVEPVDPFEGGEFHRLGAAPWATPVDYLGFEQAVDGFGERVVVAVADAAEGSMPASSRRSV
jgi:hypothetical protein